MIAKTTYIRSFTAKQRKQMETVKKNNKKLNTVPKILFFVLDKHQELLDDVARLNRIIEYKQKKIDNLNSK